MAVKTFDVIDIDPPGSAGLRAAFLSLWFVDAGAATLFFLVPYATELNPITVGFYELFGLPGVGLAAACYAAVVVVVGHVLSEPADRVFLVGLIALYGALVANNIFLLLSGTPLLEVLVV